MKFDFSILKPQHAELIDTILRGRRNPDFLIAPDGDLYLARWHVVPRNPHANVYLHCQLQSDSDRGPHCHPWANMSNILVGGYDEFVCPVLSDGQILNGTTIKRPEGSVIMRPATMAHRLIMPDWNPFGYTISLFSTGPKVREWGFWIDGEWRHWESVTNERDGVSVLN